MCKKRKEKRAQRKRRESANNKYNRTATGGRERIASYNE